MSLSVRQSTPEISIATATARNATAEARFSGLPFGGSFKRGYAAAGYFVRAHGEPAPDFGLYLYDGWRPWWPATLLDWPDFGIPRDDDAVRVAIEQVRSHARAGEHVEVACQGGHGRTGSLLACLAISTGVPPGEAVKWVREHYCLEAVETDAQVNWVHRFGRAMTVSG
jgi:hypothetical protein